MIYKNETKRTYVKDISITKTDWFDMLCYRYKLFIEIFFFCGCKDFDKDIESKFKGKTICYLRK